ncbi:MAG: hypothetical protein KAI94_12295, partial [Anaerolineales bacterium]|nr:hypothetical protein [Anaerolineales bacterium]
EHDDLACLPLPVGSVVSSSGPTMVETGVVIITLTLYDRFYSWEIGERGGFFIIQNVVFEDGIIMEFEDGDEVTWGASRSGFSVPARALDFIFLTLSCKDWDARYPVLSVIFLQSTMQGQLTPGLRSCNQT